MKWNWEPDILMLLKIPLFIWLGSTGLVDWWVIALFFIWDTKVTLK